MQVFFKQEFRSMFNKLTTFEQRLAAPFVQQVWGDLKNISGTNDFQSLPYQIARESKHKLTIHLKSQMILLDPDEDIYSIVGSGFVILISVNLKRPSILEIWSIKRTTVI